MKNFVAVLFFFLMIFGTVQAQITVLRSNQPGGSVQKRDRVHLEDHLYFQDGKLYRMRQGLKNEVKSPVELNNNTVVNPDGSYVLKNKERFRMSNGECMDMSGRIYKNQNMFNQRRTMSNSEMIGQRDMHNRTGKGAQKMPQKGTKRTGKNTPE